MDNQENEVSMISQKKTSMNKTQNTFLSTGSSHKFKINTLYRMTSPNNTKYLPPIKKAAKLYQKSFTKKANNSNIKYDLQSNIDSNNLKQRLSDSKVDINMKNGELTELKIKNFKLAEENKSIKNLIINILGVNDDKAYLKNEIIEKIENCTPSDEDKKKLKNVYDFIKLKIEIGLKKEKIADINKQIEYYNKNAKTKILSDLENEYKLKSTHQTHIQMIVEKLKKEVENNKSKLYELKNIFNNKKNIISKIKAEANSVEKELFKIEDKRDKLDSEVIELRERQRKLQERIKIGKYKNERDENLIDKKNYLESIDEYIQKRDSLLEEIDSRKKNIKNLETELTNLNTKIKELNSKNDALSAKMDIYNKEGPKLIQKSYEPLSNQKNLKDLEEKLKLFKKEFQETKEQHEGKQAELKTELDKQNEIIEDNNKIINKNNDEKNGLQKELDDLNQKLSEIKKNLEDKEQKIKEAENKLNNFLTNKEKINKEIEEKEKLIEEENKKNEENEKKEQLKKEKEYKKDIYNLKKQIEKYKDEDKIMIEENKNLKIEIDEYENTIKNNKNIDEKIKEATEKLNKLKSE